MDDYMNGAKDAIKGQGYYPTSRNGFLGFLKYTRGYIVNSNFFQKLSRLKPRESKLVELSEIKFEK